MAPAPGRRLLEGGSDAVPGDAGAVILWDNANIVESFPELTLPLTFSVAVELYAAVYRGACATLGVPRATIEREARTFDQMLGLLQGRVYYNLGSWYRVLSLLPGFRLTSGFLEAMMGARRPGSGADERTVVVAAPARARELATMTVRLAYRLARFEGDAIAFRRRIAGLLDARRPRSPQQADPGSSPAALLDEFDRLRERGLRDWRAPILNDVFLMVAHGALRRVADRWLGPEAPGLVNGLLGGCRVVSAEPGAELLAIAAAIRADPSWASLVASLSPDELVVRLHHDARLAGLGSLIDRYLAAWGDRAPRELQLDRRTYQDDPAALLATLRPLVAGRGPGGSQTTSRPSAGISRRVRRRLLAHPAGPVRLAIFNVLLRATRRHVQWREEMRLARGQLFGIGRRIFRDLGIALHDGGVLDDPSDLHYLTLGELRGLVAGTHAGDDPREIVRLRRARYTTYASLARLPGRLETKGPITDPLRFVALPSVQRGVPPGVVPLASPALAAPTEWQGTGAAVGRVRAACLRVTEPTGVEPEPGRIIVAQSTDPGWVPILVGAAGLAVEQGGLLSHSAIVARELRIPTVVGLPGLLDRVRDGDVLELDGWTGTVRLVPAGVAAP
ncbi:MAG TPA: PEP-utilizing enzyme [Candidatus Limnocylindrales bacterium]